jgi:hypothetical protein
LTLIESAINGIRQDGIRIEYSLFALHGRISAAKERRYGIAKCRWQESRVIGLTQLVPKELKPVRFFVMMTVAALSSAD